jgi:hypothetical protein
VVIEFGLGPFLKGGDAKGRAGKCSRKAERGRDRLAAGRQSLESERIPHCRGRNAGLRISGKGSSREIGGPVRRAERPAPIALARGFFPWGVGDLAG